MSSIDHFILSFKLPLPLKLMPSIKLLQPLELLDSLKPVPLLHLVPSFEPGLSRRPSLDGVLYLATDPEWLGAWMHMHSAEVKRFQSVQLEPYKEVENGKLPIERASTDESRQLVRSDLVHGVDQTARHLDPVGHLRPLERASVLTEFDRLVRLRDQREEVVSEAPVRAVFGPRIQPHQLPLGSATLDRRHGVPRVLAFEHRRRGFGVLVADSIGGMKAVELMLEHGGQHAEMLERLQREAALLIADMDVETTRCVHKHVELSSQQINQTLHPTQRLGTEPQRRRFDLHIALKVSI